MKPFIFSDIVTVDMEDYFVTFNANTQMDGYINDELFAILDGEDLVIVL